MVTAFTSVTWEEALRGFFLHKRAVRAQKTAKWYKTYATALVEWANSQGLTLDVFTKRHLDEYLVYRSDAGRSATTLHHDALVATVFTEWCKSNGYLDRDPLAEYKVRNAPRTYKYMPTANDVRGLLEGILDYYDVRKNPDARFAPASRRSFHRDRNYAIELTKLDTACRIGEVFAFKVSDYQSNEHGMQLTIRQAKGREPRILPVSPECAASIDAWLKIRKRIMSNVPVEEDEGWLFISETGSIMDPGNYLRNIKKVCEFAGLPKELNNHSQRRFSINRNGGKRGGLAVRAAYGRPQRPKDHAYLYRDQQ